MRFLLYTQWQYLKLLGFADPCVATWWWKHLTADGNNIWSPGGSFLWDFSHKVCPLIFLYMYHEIDVHANNRCCILVNFTMASSLSLPKFLLQFVNGFQ